MKAFLLALALLLHICPAMAGDVPNARLTELVAEDQAARRSGADPERWAAIARSDAERRKEVLALLAAGALKLPVDYEHAALIMQHGTQPDDYRLAHALATVAAAVAPDRRAAVALQKVSWDRLMRSLGKPQWYGTQRRVDRNTGATVTLPVDPDISEAHRSDLNQPAVLPAADGRSLQ